VVTLRGHDKRYIHKTPKLSIYASFRYMFVSECTKHSFDVARWFPEHVIRLWEQCEYITRDIFVKEQNMLSFNDIRAMFKLGCTINYLNVVRMK
jgi:hypothetical protein